MALLWLIAWNKGLQTRHLELRPDINKYEDRPEQDWKMVWVTSWFSKTRSHTQLLLPLRQQQITRQHWYLRLNRQWVQLTISLHSQEVNMLCTLIFVCTIRNDYKTLQRVKDDCNYSSKVHRPTHWYRTEVCCTEFWNFHWQYTANQTMEENKSNHIKGRKYGCCHTKCCSSFAAIQSVHGVLPRDHTNNQWV